MRAYPPSRSTAAVVAVLRLIDNSRHTMKLAKTESNNIIEAANDSTFDAQEVPEEAGQGESGAHPWLALLPPMLAALLVDDGADADAPAGQATPKERALARKQLASLAHTARLEYAEVKASKVRHRMTRAARLIAARRLNGWDQSEAARRLGWLGSTQLNLLEQGNRDVTLEHILKAAEVYQVSTDFLLGRACAEQEEVARQRALARLDTINNAIFEFMREEERATGGVNANLLRKVADAARAVVAAHDRLGRLQFEEVPGGALLDRRIEELEAVLAQAAKALATFDGDAERIRAILRNSTAANDSI